jgi:hypothetical protein
LGYLSWNVIFGKIFRIWLSHLCCFRGFWFNWNNLFDWNYWGNNCNRLNWSENLID